MRQSTLGELRQRCWRYLHGAHDTELAPLLLSLTNKERHRLYRVLEAKLQARTAGPGEIVYTPVFPP